MSEYLMNFGIKDLIDIPLLYCFSPISQIDEENGFLNMFIGILVFLLVWIVVSHLLKNVADGCSDEQTG